MRARRRLTKPPPKQKRTASAKKPATPESMLKKFSQEQLSALMGMITDDNKD